MEPLQVIAAPRRLRILELVWERERSAGDIAAQFDVSWSAISQHLKILRAAGFVIERREGTSRLYRADQAALGSLRAVVEEHWRARLADVKRLAEDEHRARTPSGSRAERSEAGGHELGDGPTEVASRNDPASRQS